MAGLLVDSNILIDIATGDPAWRDWSASALAEAGRSMRPVINPVIYAEVSVAFTRIEALERLLPATMFHREDIPWEAAFLAGKVFRAYRQKGGIRTSPLPDFFIGAHAAIRGYVLLTHDRGRFRSYFPDLRLISPPVRMTRTC
ncbi:type II toxin-antitoxin system VapC family toxin [Marinibaculum pumilum]|uniref:Type II toxin-antitoxin system VapC family toxin n=1 Tax=Marinibaculum pumilum TaxID=1766165 RepID=A0ABV7KWZ6_9PROT